MVGIGITREKSLKTGRWCDMGIAESGNVAEGHLKRDIFRIRTAHTATIKGCKFGY